LFAFTTFCSLPCPLLPVYLAPSHVKPLLLTVETLLLTFEALLLTCKPALLPVKPLMLIAEPLLLTTKPLLLSGKPLLLTAKLIQLILKPFLLTLERHLFMLELLLLKLKRHGISKKIFCFSDLNSTIIMFRRQNFDFSFFLGMRFQRNSAKILFFRSLEF